MFKELFLAIILGTLLGFGITGGYLATRKNHLSDGQNTPSPTITPAGTLAPTQYVSPTPRSVTPADKLTITSPENESVVTTSELTLTGQATTKSVIVITTLDQTFYLTTDNSGNFSQPITLSPGANYIQVDHLDSQDNVDSQKILVTYSTAKF